MDFSLVFLCFLESREVRISRESVCELCKSAFHFFSPKEKAEASTNTVPVGEHTPLEE